MAQVGEVSVKLSALTAAFQKSLDKAAERLRSFSDAAKKISLTTGAASAALSASIYKVADAANTQRVAMMRLSTAAKASGAITQDQVKELFAYASELQGVTTIGDEATIKTMALLASFRMTKDQIKSIIPGIQDMSAAMGVDMNTAAIAVGRALDGTAGGLSRYGVRLSDAEERAVKLGDAQQRVAIISDALSRSVGGAAGELAKTGKGAMTQFSNAVGDLNEEFGFLIDSQVSTTFKAITSSVNNAISFIQRLDSSTKDMIGNFVVISTVVLTATTALAGFAVVLPFLISGFSSLVALVSAIAAPMLQFVFYAALLIAVAGALRAAWAENIGGIREKFDWLADGAANVGMFIRDMFFDLVDGIEKAFDGILHFVAEVFATIPRIVVKYLELVAKSLEKTFDTLSTAASALGFKDLAKGLRSSKGEAAGLRATFQGMQGEIDSAVNTVREFTNPIKLLKTGFKGTFEFVTGEGGAEFAETAGAFLTETGDLIGRGWKQILKDLGIELSPEQEQILKDMGSEFLPEQEVKALGKTMGEEAGKAISDEVLRAQDAFRERLADLQGREQIETSPFRDITQAFVDAEKERADIIKLAADAGMSNVEALQLSENHLIRQAAAAVHAARTTTEQAEAADFARAELQRAGIGLEKFNAQLTGIDWVDVQAERPPDIGQMLSDAAGQAISGAGVVTPEVAKGAGEDIGGMLSGVIEGQAPAIGDALGVGLTAAGAGAAGPIAGAIVAGLQTVFSIVQGAIDSLVSGIAQLIPEQRLSRAFSSAAPAAITLGLALAYLGAVVASLAVVIGPPLLVFGPAIMLAVAAIGLLVFASTLLSMAIMGFVTGPLLMLTAAVVVMTGLFGVFAALIPETEAFQRAMSVVSYAVDRFVGVLSKGMLKPLMAFAGLFAAFMKALEPVLNMFVAGINKLAPHLFNMMRDLAVAFLHLVDFSMHVGNAFIDLAKVMGNWFVLPLIKATNAIAGAFLDGAAMMLDVISWMAKLPLVGNEEMAAAAAAGAETARGMKKSGDGLVSEVEAIIGGLDAFKATPSDFAELAKARDELAGLTYQQAIEESMRLEKETEDFSEKVGEFGESLTNVPQGFKVVAARFQAIVAGESPAALPADTVTPETVVPQQTFIVEQVSLAAENIEDFVRQLLEQSERKGIRYGGAMQARLGLDGGMGR